jgi:hypothetical protein
LARRGQKIIFATVFSLDFAGRDRVELPSHPVQEEVASMPHTHPVVHFEILGKDQKLLEEFYKGVFHWEIDPVMEGYSLVKPGSGIGGASAPWGKAASM